MEYVQMFMNFHSSILSSLIIPNLLLFIIALLTASNLTYLIIELNVVHFMCISYRSRESKQFAYLFVGLSRTLSCLY